MEKKFTNKILTQENIIELVNIIESYYKDVKALQEEERSKEKTAKAKGEYYFAKNVYADITYSLTLNNNETIKEKNDPEWFKDNIKTSAKSIKEFDIYVSASNDNKFESLSIYATQKRIDINSSSLDIGKNQLFREIENFLGNLPARYDTLVQKDNIRKIVPSLSISLIIGIILSAVFFVLSKLDILPFDFSNDYIIPLISTAILVLVSFIGSLLIPTKNHSLYKNFKFEQVYSGYDSEKYRSIYKNDYNQFKNECEICIGDNAKMPEVRKQIAKNFAKSKKMIYIELAISVVAIILFFVL